MAHLTDEQIEDVLAGRAEAPSHAEHCAVCRGRLAESRAVRARLRAAFGGVHAGDAFRQRLREHLGEGGPAREGATRAAPDGRRRTVARLWPVLAAAAVLIAAASVALYLSQPSSALAARRQLAAIHHKNLLPHDDFYVEADAGKLADYFVNKLGFVPAMPRLGEGMVIKGCCVAHFRGKIVGSYVVETPRGFVSMIVVTDSPASLGLRQTVQRGDRTYGAGSFARCEMVAARLGQYTYCAVGVVTQDLLADLLDRLMTGNPE